MLKLFGNFAQIGREKKIIQKKFFQNILFVSFDIFNTFTKRKREREREEEEGIMDPAEQEKLYEDLDDTEYDVLKKLNTEHLNSWSHIQKPHLSTMPKCQQLSQLDKQLQSLFTSYKGPAFRGFGFFKCGGFGDVNADILLLLRYPGTIANKVGKVFFQNRRRNKQGEEYLYATEPSKIVNMLKERGLRDRTFYVAYVIPAKLPDGDPSKLLTTVFSNYVRRRMEIVNPKCVVTCRAWTTKFATGGFTYRGSETAKMLRVGLARDIKLPKIGGNKSVINITVARMVNQYNLNRECFGNEKVNHNYTSCVDPLIRVIKKKTQQRVLLRVNRMLGDMIGAKRGTVDAISLMASGVKLIADDTNTKKRRRSMPKRPTPKPGLGDIASLSPFSPMQQSFRQQQQQQALFFHSHTDYSSSSVVSDVPDTDIFPVDWIVSDYVGLMGNASADKLGYTIAQTKANIVITIDGRNCSADCEYLNCQFASLQLGSDLIQCLYNEMRIMGENSGMDYGDIVTKIKELRTYASSPIDPTKSFKPLKVYKMVEYVMLNTGNQKEDGNMKHLPVVLIQTDCPKNTDKLHLNVYGDNRAYLTTAVVLYAIRDVLARIKNGLPSKLGNDIANISPELQLRDGEEHIIDEILIPPRRLYGKNPTPFFDKQGKTKKFQGISSQTREVFERDEMKQIINMMNASVDIKPGWNGFTTTESLFLRFVTEYLSKMEANANFREPVSVKREIDEQAKIEQEEEKTILEHFKNDSEFTPERSVDQSSTDPRSHIPYCRFCVCHIHGHKDFLTNECKVKGCGTMFKWKDRHWKSTHKNDDSFSSLYSLALKKVRIQDIVPKEIDEINVHPKDTLMEMYRDDIGPSEYKKCACVVCKGEQCS